MAFLIAAFAESELSQQIATSWIMCSGILFFRILSVLVKFFVSQINDRHGRQGQFHMIWLATPTGGNRPHQPLIAQV